MSFFTPRKEKLLKAVIETYVNTAEPVSSKLLEKSGLFKVSSATLRNEMNDLEGLGFLTQLHTSGGRVPTDKAYRYFVDNLMEETEPDTKFKKKICAALSRVKDPREVNKKIAQLLSEVSDNLVITNVLENEDFYKIGLSALFELPEFREFEKAFKITSFFDNFDRMFSRIVTDFFRDIDDDIFSDFRVLIGCEVPVREAKDETIIFTRYNLPQHYTGSLTMIGPTRMDYGKNISLIKYVTKQLNELYNDK